jgi:hypothetical protein
MKVGLSVTEHWANDSRKAAAPEGLWAPSSNTLCPEGNVTDCSRPAQEADFNPVTMSCSETENFGDNSRTVATAKAALRL